MRSRTDEACVEVARGILRAPPSFPRDTTMVCALRAGTGVNWRFCRIKGVNDEIHKKVVFRNSKHSSSGYDTIIIQQSGQSFHFNHFHFARFFRSLFVSGADSSFFEHARTG